MPHRLEFYRQQRDQALKHAEEADVDREGWLRIAAEWQILLETLSAELGHPEIEKPDSHVLDS